MSFLGGYIATVYSAFAYRKFAQKKYFDAIRLFEKASKFESDNNVKKITYSYLGRCYVAVKKDEKALEVMTRAYELFHEKGEKKIDGFQKKEYKEFLEAYSYALNKLGRLERAKEIDEEAKGIM